MLNTEISYQWLNNRVAPSFRDTCTIETLTFSLIKTVKTVEINVLRRCNMSIRDRHYTLVPNSY